MTDDQINEAMAKDPEAYPAMQAHEIDAIVKWVCEQDPTHVMTAGRMRYMMSYWIRTRNAAPRDAKIGMAFNHIQECLREIVRLRAELDGIAGRAKAARVSESTVSRWVHGETCPSFDESMRLIERLPRIVGDSIRELIPPADEFQSRELDLNGDATVGLDDALQGAVESGRMQQGSLEEIHKALQAGFTLSAHQRLTLTESISNHMRMLAKMQNIVCKCGLRVAK